MYSDHDLSLMPKMLAEHWLGQMDEDLMIAILLSGNTGYDNLSRESLIEKFEEVFGDEYFGRD